jgi:hypothetical protein
MRGGMRRGCCEDARVRVGQCGAGVGGRWLADAGSGSADRIRAVGVVGPCAAARHGWHECADCGSRESAARSGWRGWRFAGSLEWRMWSGADGRGGKGRVGGRFGRSAAVGSAAVWVGVRVAGWCCGACAGGGTGLWSATRRGMRASRRAAAVGSWLVVCAASTRLLLRLPVLPGDFSGAGLSFEGPGGCEAGCAVAAVEDARVRVGQCGAGGVG